jgi:hypothetical protein
MPAHQTYPNPAGGDSAVATSLPFSALTDGSNNQGQMLVSDGAALGLDPVTPGAISANYLWEIPVSGAEPLNAEALVYNASLDVWEPTLLYLSELTDVSVYGLVSGDVLAWNGSLGIWQPVPQSGGGGGGSVTSVFTRTGAVIALSGDYTVSQITGAAPSASPTFTGTVNLATLIASGNVTLSSELIDGTSSAGTSGQVLSSTGTKTQWVTPSGGGGGATVPALSSFTWVNQGSSSARQTVSSGPIEATIADSSSLNWRGLFVAVPATPYKLTVNMRGYQPAGSTAGSNTATFGLYFYDGTKLEGFDLLLEGSGLTKARIEKLNSVNADNSTAWIASGGAGVVSDGILYKLPSSTWFQLRNNGTTMYFDYSIDGANFINLFSEAVGTFLTPTEFGFGGISVTSGAEPNVIVNMLSWTVAANATL